MTKCMTPAKVKNPARESCWAGAPSAPALACQAAKPPQELVSRSWRQPIDGDLAASHTGRHGRHGAGRFVGGRPRAAGDLPPARRLGQPGRLGVGRLQPGPGGAAVPAALAARAWPGAGHRRRALGLRAREPRLRPGRRHRAPARRPLRAGGRGRRRRLRRARADAGGLGLRARGRTRLGASGRDRSGARPGPRGRADRAGLLAVDLLRPGSGRRGPCGAARPAARAESRPVRSEPSCVLRAARTWRPTRPWPSYRPRSRRRCS